jgi:hypothetical protein
MDMSPVLLKSLEMSTEDMLPVDMLPVELSPTDMFDVLSAAGVLVVEEEVDTLSPRLPVREGIDRSTDFERLRLLPLLLLLFRLRLPSGLGPAARALLLLARCRYVRFRLYCRLSSCCSCGWS